MTDEPAVEAIGLAKSYGKVKVLQGLDLAIPRGTVFALLGPNGAGKTTTVRILATLIRPDAGKARVAGFDAVRERREVQRRISLTGQYAAVDGMQTGRENLRMMGRLFGLSRKEAKRRTAELLAMFDLEEAGGRRVSTYSGGMRRRLDLAASLVIHPEVIFLDEPTTGLDLRSRQSMWDVVGQLAGSGVTVFLTTQYLEEADLLADSIGVMDGGRMVAVGTGAELKRQVAGRRLRLELTDEASFWHVRDLLGTELLGCSDTEHTVTVATDGDAAQVRVLLDRLDPSRRLIRKFSVQEASLDDVFLALTGNPAGDAAGGGPRKETADV